MKTLLRSSMRYETHSGMGAWRHVPFGAATAQSARQINPSPTHCSIHDAI